jgi:hypothetical protein
MAFLRSAMKETFRSVLRPDFPAPSSRYYMGPPTPADYILVPRLALAGTWKVRDIIHPEQLGRLAAFTNALEKGRK